LSLGYIASEPHPNWDGSYTNTAGNDTEDNLIAIVRFHHPIASLFGPPSDEAFKGHPLSARGLEPYSAMEVKSSSWIRRLERMNSVHPNHRPMHFRTYRHFVFAFHDSTFECVAKDLDVTLLRGSMNGALERMSAMLNAGPPAP
jgi:hypothetical protein